MFAKLIITAVTLITGSVGLATLGLWLFRSLVDLKQIKREEAVVSFLFNALAIVYAVILAFVVFAVWEKYAGAQQAVTMEAASLVLVYRDTQTLPQPEQAQVQKLLIDYTQSVMAREWASHGKVLPHNTADALNPVWKIYRGASVGDAAQDRLHNLEYERHLRHLAGEASLPVVFWPLLIGGGIVTIGFSYFFLMESQITQYMLTAILAVVLSAVLFLIYTLNLPFTGQVPVSKDPFRHAIEVFHAMNFE